jgi:ubiquinone biosynthesis protein
MPWEALDTPGKLGRLRDIAAVLIRNGFGEVVQRIGMAAALERAGKVLGWRVSREPTRLSTPDRGPLDRP